MFLVKSLASGWSNLFRELSHFPLPAFYYGKVVVSVHTLLSGVWKSFQISVEILDLKQIPGFVWLSDMLKDAKYVGEHHLVSLNLF